MTETKKRYYDELNIFRALIIAWVVIGHSFDGNESISGFMHFYAYSFHMAAFFVLSGFLFASKLKNSSSIKSKALLTKNRAERLLVPYIFFTAVSYVLKMFFEDYANNALSGNIVLDTVLGINNPNGGIWFLYALFFISLFGILLSQISIYGLFALSVVLKIIFYIHPTGIAPLDYISKYSIFFFAGAVISLFYPKLADFLDDKFKQKKNKILLFLIAIILLAISFAVTYLNQYRLKSSVASIFICVLNIAVWYVAAQAVNQSKTFKKTAMVVGNYGMDIYMIGYYVQIAIRVICGSMLHMPYTVYSLLMCILGLLLPIPVSKYIVRKFKITRMLMLGDFSKVKKD